jgi:signal transduction histidine kinase
MLLALFAAMVGIFSVSNLFYDHFFATPDWYPIRSTAILVRKILDQTPAVDIFNEQNRLQALLDRDIDILSAGEIPPEIARRLALSEESPAYIDSLFYLPLHNGTFWARMSPSFRQNKPLMKPLSIFISCLVMAVVAVIVGFLFTYPVARRLKRLENAAEKIRRGDIRSRVTDTSRDLIGNVGRCFNQMADRIQLLVLVRQHLLSEMARKFQSPILKIGKHLGALREETDAERIEKRHRKIDRAVDTIEQLVTGLLLNEKVRRSDGSTAVAGDGTGNGSRYLVAKFIGRMSLGILSVLLLHQLFMLGVSQVAYRYLNTDPGWYPVRTVAALTGRAVEKSDLENRMDLVASLRRELGLAIELVPSGSAPEIIETPSRVFAGGLMYGTRNGREAFGVLLPGTDQVLLMDPGYALYRRQPSLLFHGFSLGFEFLLTGVFGFFLSLPIIRNIRKLGAGIEKIRRDEQGARVEIPANKPIGSLAQGLNHMARRIESLLEHQRHLIQAVAHEIRTPVSRIRFHLEMMGEAKGTDAMAQYAADIEGELGELNLLVRELATLSALDAMAKDPPLSPVLLRQALSGIITAHRKTHPRIRIALSGPIPETLSVRVHPVFFKRAVQNILSNALRHAEKCVTLSCTAATGGVRVEIRDDGPGIPEEDREKVFHPFTRLDGSRNRSSGGFGLGLTIVSRIVSLHGGTVVIEDNIPRGTCVSTFWPGPTEAAAQRS